MAKALQIITAPLSLIDRDLGNAARTLVLTAIGGAVGGPLGAAIGAGIGSTLGATIGRGPLPQVPASQEKRLAASIDPRAFRKDVLGQTAMPVDVRYEEWSGEDQDFCDWIVCVASHAIDGIDEIWLDTDLAWTAVGGVQGKYRGYFDVPNIVLEGSPANAFTFASGKWNSAARLTGCAYLRLRFKVTGNGKKAESPFSSGPTSRITIIGRGAKIYDPRRDSTVAGGFGPMRADDQSTWRFVADDGGRIGENLPLLALRRLLGWRITNPVTGQKRLATGAGLPRKRIDLPSFIVAANLADELVNRSAGGQEPRYHGAGVVSEGDDQRTVMTALCAGMCARLTDAGGKIGIIVAHNDLALAAADPGLVTDDVIGGFTWDPDPALEAAPNIIRGRYVDASTESLYQLIDYPEVRIPSVDGIDRIFTLDLGYVESVSQAQRIAKQVLQRKQYERTFSAPFDIRAWGWPVDKIVPVTFSPLRFDRQLFRVAAQDIGRDGSCPMTLTGESPDIYAWDADDRAPIKAVAMIPYDPARSPLAQAIDAATASAAHQILSGTQTVPYPVSSTADAVTVVAFDGTIDTGERISFPAAMIGDLTAGTGYVLLWGLSAKAYKLLPVGGQAAIAEMASDDNVIVRYVTTARSDGSYPSDPTPPGGDGGGGYNGRSYESQQ